MFAASSRRADLHFARETAKVKSCSPFVYLERSTATAGPEIQSALWSREESGMFSEEASGD